MRIPKVKEIDVADRTQFTQSESYEKYNTSDRYKTNAAVFLQCKRRNELTNGGGK